MSFGPSVGGYEELPPLVAQLFAGVRRGASPLVPQPHARGHDRLHFYHAGWHGRQLGLGGWHQRDAFFNPSAWPGHYNGIASQAAGKTCFAIKPENVYQIAVG